MRTKKNPAAVALGRLGGLKRGWRSMSEEARKARAAKALRARWPKSKGKKEKS